MTRPIEDVARAILDGTAIDWHRVESGAAPADHQLIDQLKTLAALRMATRGAGPRPTSWGHLQRLERIGQGSFGVVYRAWDPRLDREVALKLLPAEPIGADLSASGLIEEGRLLARVRHPNVVTIYGAERIEGQVGLWMELLNGRTLERAIRDGAAWKPDEVVRIGVELCRAVAAVHAAGLLHRDIKAHNIMLADDGRLVLMDFGTGRDLGTTSDVRAAGTPLYLAPEVLGGGEATVRSDVYSVGVLLYRLLTGSYPVSGRDLADLRQAHAARRGTALPRSAHQMPSRLRRVVAVALHPDPVHRFASADALGAALSAQARAPAVFRVALSAVTALAVVAVASLAWGLRERALAEPNDTPVASPVTSVSTIAVLPFRNLSAEPDGDYFVDGLTTEVIRNLAAIDGLEVRSQTSSFFFKGRARDLRAIGDQLGVGLILEAEVLRVGQRLRVNVQLVRIADDVPLWSEKYDRTLDDVFAIQDEISRAIVNELRLTLGRGQRRYHTSLRAYELYLRGRSLVGRAGTDNARRAARLFEAAVAIDPAFAPAHAGLADAYAELSWQLADGLPFDEALRRMRPAAARALALDPLLAEAHAAMGITSARDRDWTSAARSFERATTLNPSLTHIQASYAFTTLLPTGQLERAEQVLTAALARDPLSPILRRELAWVQFAAGRFEDAATSFRRVLAIDPLVPFAAQGLARALTFAGRPEEAIAVWERRPASDGDWERWLTHAYVRAGRRADVERLVEAHRAAHPYRQAIVYAAIGDTDRTLDALARAAQAAPHRTALLMVNPELAAVRDTPGFQAVRARLNLR